MATVRRTSKSIKTGDRFSLLVVTGERSWSGNNYMIPCRCDCGTEKLIAASGLMSGMVKSCGCWKRHKASETAKARKSGESRFLGDDKAADVRRLRVVLKAMIQRCHKEGSPGFYKYGARGIVVCEEWRKSWKGFVIWAICNGYRQGLEIDRADNNGPYSHSNCSWVERKRNARNKRNTHLVTAFGETKNLSAWMEDERCKATLAALTLRLNRLGWDAERAITTPPQPQKRVS